MVIVAAFALIAGAPLAAAALAVSHSRTAASREFVPASQKANGATPGRATICDPIPNPATPWFAFFSTVGSLASYPNASVVDRRD